MRFPDLVPGTHVKVVGIIYDDYNRRAFTQYLTNDNGKTFGLGKNMEGIVLARVDDFVFLMMNSKKWGMQSGWCGTLETFEVIK